MTNLEHIIENTLIHFENGEDAEKILQGIAADPNYEDDVHRLLPVYTIYEICQYVWCTYLDNGNELKKNNLKDFSAQPIPENGTSIYREIKKDGTTVEEEHQFIRYHCPSCNYVVGEYFGSEPPKTKDDIRWKTKFCGNCGQAIDWRMRND